VKNRLTILAASVGLPVRSMGKPTRSFDRFDEEAEREAKAMRAVPSWRKRPHEIDARNPLARV